MKVVCAGVNLEADEPCPVTLVSLPLSTIAGVMALQWGCINQCWLVLSWALASLVDAFAGIASC